MKVDSALVHHVSPSPNFGDRRGKAVDAIILHYTGMSTGTAALARLCAEGSNVSCHYLVWEDGRIEQLVAERERAWHAGQSYWGGEDDLNAVSIGIEIVNSGHDGGCPPYPDVQIDSVVELVKDICARHAIKPARVLAHSDIAPARKEDPGEYFPWDRLAVAGVALRVPAAPIVEGFSLVPGSTGQTIAHLQGAFARVGYKIEFTGFYDAQTEAVVRAFQRRFRPSLVDGVADVSTQQTLRAVTLALSS